MKVAPRPRRVCTLRGPEVRRILRDEFGIELGRQATYDLLHRIGIAEEHHAQSPLRDANAAQLAHAEHAAVKVQGALEVGDSDHRMQQLRRVRTGDGVSHSPAPCPGS